MKRIYIYTLLLIAALVAPPITLAAQTAPTVIASDYCGAEGDGSNLQWQLTSDGTLTISGSGRMKDYTSKESAPWKGYSEQLKHLIIQNGVTSIGNFAFLHCSGFTGTLTIPKSVITIGWNAFLDCSGFTGSLTIPESVTTIGESAFRSCSGFTGSLTIPESVTEIGIRAFRGCSGFTGSLTIPDGVTTIGKYAFDGCSGFTGTLTIPDGVTTIGWGAFMDCSGLTSCHFNAIRCADFHGNLGYNPFNGVEFTSFTFGDKVEHIPAYILYGKSGLTGTLTIPDSVTTIGEGAFHDCSGFTGTLTIPDGVTTIGDFAFSGCENVTGEVIIPNSVTTLGNMCFSDTGIDAIVFGENITEEIPYKIASGTWKVNTITCLSANPPSVYRDFLDINTTTSKLRVPIGNIDDYREAYVWCDFRKIVGMYKVTFSSTNGKITDADGKKYTGNMYIDAESTPTLKVVPDEGYALRSLEIAGEDYTANVAADGTFTTPAITANTSITAVFDVAYEVKATATNGRITFSETGETLTSADVLVGSALALKAVPDKWHKFSLLEIDGVDYTANVAADSSFTTPAVTAAMTIKATFEAIPVYTLTVDINDSKMGEVTATGGEKDDNGKYFDGSVVTLTAKANDGYEFVQWEDDSTSTTRTVTITKDTTVKATFKIIPQPQYITWNQAVTEFQEGETIDLTAVASSGLAVEYRVTSGNGIVSDSKLTATAPGKIVVEASQPGNDEYLAAAVFPKIFTATVKPKPQTITWNQEVTEFVIGKIITLTAEASSGLDVEYTVILGNATVNESFIIANAPGDILVEASQPGNDYYLAATAVRKTFTAVTEQKPQTITWNQEVTELREGETIELTAEASSGLTVEYTVISGNATINSSKLTATAPGEITVEATQPGNDEYLAATAVRKTFTATAKPKPKPQTITWNQAVTEFQEGETIELTAEASSGLTVEYTVISGNATISGSKLTATAPGEIVVEALQPGNDAYLAATAVRKTFTATAVAEQKPQTITWNQAVTEFQEGETIELTAEASSGLTVEYTVISGNATISGSKLTATAPGEIIVEATQPGNDEYLAATAVGKTFTAIAVTEQKPQTITWNQAVTELREGETIELTAEASSGLTVEYTVISGNATISGSKLTATAPGEITVEATQPGNDEYLAAESVRKDFKATAVQSDIDLVFSDTSIVNIVDNELIIESGNYTLYDVRGMLVEKGIAPTRITLQRNTTYILRIDDKSAKFMIR